MKRTFFLIILLVSLAYAQVPGYIGKTRHIHGGIKFFPSFGVPVNLEGPHSGYVVYGMNYRLELGMDFMVSRKSSVGFNAHYYNTATGQSYFTDPNGLVAIEGGAIGAVFKTHFGSWVAPLGGYYSLEAGGLIYDVSDPAKYFPGQIYPYTNGAFYINNGFGRTHIFAHRVTLDYGFEIGIVFPPYTGYNFTNARMAVQYVVNAYVKIGGIF